MNLQVPSALALKKVALPPVADLPVVETTGFPRFEPQLKKCCLIFGL